MSCIGKMKPGRCALAGAALLGLTGAAVAAPEGCFERRYDASHLAGHPGQVVAEISVAFGDFGGDVTPWMDVQVRAADQGYAAEAGQGGGLLGTIARCSPSDATLYGWSSSVECDGGTLHIEALDDRKLVMRTGFFLVGTGDDCGGEMDLAETPGQSVTYRLNRVPDQRCAGRWE